MDFTKRLNCISLIFALVMSGCGGSTDLSITPPRIDSPNNPTLGGNSQSEHTIQGRIDGLQGNLQLTMDTQGGRQNHTASQNGSFSFTTPIRSGDSFEVSITEQPPSQYCVVKNGFGSARDSLPLVRITCTAKSATTSVSGTLLATAGITVDSDINDPSGAYQNNYDNYQRINNLVTLHGFSSAEPTGRPGDRFEHSADLMDVYQVSLQAGQIVQLQVIDYDKFDLSLPFSGDLDLMLVDSNYEIAAISESQFEFEEVVVPAAGDYRIVVYAFSGASKYVLRLLPPQNLRQAVTVGEFTPNEVIVQFEDEPKSRSVRRKDGTRSRLNLTNPGTERAALSRLERDSSQRHRRQSGEDAWSWLRNNNSNSYEKVQTLLDIKALSQQDGVRFAEPNYWVSYQMVPNDQFYPYQWHYPLINLPQAWEITTGVRAGNPVIVAVIDSGIFSSHPDLQGQLVPGYDFIADPLTAIDGDGIDPNPEDPGDSRERGQSSWHGTHVAGTIAALTNNGIGAAGVAPGAKIMPLRATGLGGRGNIYDTGQAILFAARLPNDSRTLPARKADIINMSLAGPNGLSFMQDIVNQARNAGVILVAAAGNENDEQPQYPSSYDGVISVSAVDIRKNRAHYSSYGRTITIAAPGGNVSADLNSDGYPDGVLSLVADDTSGQLRPSYRFSMGTSMASPHVAGVLALMRAIHPDLTPDDVERIIRTGEITDDIGAPGWDIHFGHGLINALKAVQVAERLAGSTPNPTAPDSRPVLMATPSQVNFELSATQTLNISNVGGGNPRVTEIASDAPWLTIGRNNVNPQGLGDYPLSVNRGGLTAGLHRGIVNVRFDTGGRLEIPVSIRVGSAQQGEGTLAPQYVLLVDPMTMEAAVSTEATFSAGQWSFRFNNVPVGEYFLFSGSDIDNDGYICQSGESCGIYPNLNQAQRLEVLGEAISNLQVPVDIMASLHSTMSVGSASHVRPGLRLPATLRDQP